MNCFEKVTVNAQAINWLKEKYPELCIKAGLCERIGGRLYTKTFIDPPAAQPEHEPCQWRDMVVVNLVREGINKHKARDLADHFATAAQPEQVDCPRCGHVCSQRPWQGLTHQQTKDRMQAWDGNDAYVLCRAIEQALKERNT
jgi:hypothetical protein